MKAGRQSVQKAYGRRYKGEGALASIPVVIFIVNATVAADVYRDGVTPETVRFALVTDALPGIP